MMILSYMLGIRWKLIAQSTRKCLNFPQMDKFMRINLVNPKNSKLNAKTSKTHSRNLKEKLQDSLMVKTVNLLKNSSKILESTCLTMKFSDFLNHSTIKTKEISKKEKLMTDLIWKRFQRKILKMPEYQEENLRILKCFSI